MHCQSLFTHIEDEDKAVAHFRSKLETENLAFIVCYYTEEYDAETLCSALSRNFTDIPFHGASSCHSIMTEQGVHHGPVVAILAIYDSGLHAYGTGISPLSSNNLNIKKTTNCALDMALSHAGRRGELPSLILLHSTPGSEEEIIEAIDQRFGTLVPIIGGSAADNKIEGKWSIISTQGLSDNGVSVTLFYASQPVEIAFGAGHSPTEFKGTVTKVSGRNLLEIDGRPALEVYRSWTQLHADKDKSCFLFDIASAYPLGRVAGSIYERPYFKLSHPIRETSEGRVELFTTLAEGDVVYLMQGSRRHLISRAARVVNSALSQKLETSKKIGVINIFCAGPMLNLKQDIDDVCDQINIELNHLPFICPFTFGEQGRFIGGENGHGNLMISSAIFHRPYEN